MKRNSIDQPTFQYQQQMTNNFKRTQSNRQRLSLKNLLTHSNNYHSLHTLSPTHHSQRPSTMQNHPRYTSAQTKAITETKLIRPTSQHLAYEHPINHEEKLRLKKALGMMNILAEGHQIEQSRKIELAFEFIHCLSILDNPYQKAMIYLHTLLTTLVYVPGSHFPREQLQKLASSTRNQLLSTLDQQPSVNLYKGLSGITFQEISNQLFEELNKQQELRQNERQTALQTQRELETKIDEKNRLLKKVNKQLAYFQDHPSQNLYPYIQKLEASLAECQQEIKRLTAITKQQQSQMEFQQQYNNMLAERIDDLKNKLYEYEMQQFSGLNEVQKNSELKEFQQNVAVLKDMLQKSTLRMEGMKEEYIKLQNYNENLIDERSNLAKRAAVGFGSLTPRPNYSKIFASHCIDHTQLFDQSSKPSTEDIFSSLLAQFKKFYEQSQQKPLELQRMTVESMLERERQKLISKDQGNETLKHIAKTSQQMRKTEHLAQQVKNNYNKQKQEKEELDKNRKNNR